MTHRWFTSFVSVVCCLLVLVNIVYARSSYSTTNPKIELLNKKHPSLSLQSVVYDYTAHTRGNIQLAIANNGTFGTLGTTIPDPFTGEAILSCEFPKNSNILYLWVAAIWIGAVVGRDTLVTCGNEDFYITNEFWPDVEPFKPPGGFRYESIDINSPFYSPDANSEQDIICEYTDTLDNPAIVQSDPTDNRPHIPLGIKVYQRSMAWSFAYAEDFILFDYQVENIGKKDLRDLYIGVYVDGDAWHLTRLGPNGWNDDIAGFYPTHPAPEGCGFIDTINIAYHADNDGDPTNGKWNETSARSAVGVRVVRTPAEKLDISYNWWIIDYSDPSRDFGPRQKPKPDDPFRNMGSRLGTPEGDPNKYYLLRHKEFDYDQIFTASIQPNDTMWLYPNQELAPDFSNGYDARYLLSFGPFDISPGQRLPVSFAWVAGADLHKNPNDFANLFSPGNPQAFYNSLDFSDLALNSRWASWVYDNPGVDTDGDGYYGKYRICYHDSSIVRVDTIINGTDTTYETIWDYLSPDTSWYEGDGVPDFKGAGPPPAPKIRVIPDERKLIVRWNGYYSETTPDIFLRLVDFEGYRVYIGRDDRISSFSLVASYDRENYNQFVYRQISETEGDWVLENIPFTIDSLRIMYNDSTFDPLQYTRSSPFSYNDELYYFEKQDFNASDLSSQDGIHKVYPNVPKPSKYSDEWADSELVFDYNIPLPKYYEYELVIDNLLPTVPYFVAVTTMDFGSPVANLPPMETSPINNMVAEYPLFQPNTTDINSLDVFVYPNPYRIDANYRQFGYEGRTEFDRPNDRVRALHFVNLPPKCKISIYSLDGDLIKVIDHDKSPNEPQASHDEWDLITRNTQAVVSGLYYYVVESENRTQIGKFVILK